MDIEQVQRARKMTLRLVAGLVLALTLFIQPHWIAISAVHHAMIWTGILLIGAAICGRTWVIAHVGGRKRWEFISKGPYSVVRHPLYAFSILGTVGMAAQTASFVMILTTALVVFVVFDVVAREEENDMKARFGASYTGYLERTPRFLPKPSLWCAGTGVVVDYDVAIRTFADSSLFALAVPLYIAVRWAHEASIIPALYELP